MLKKLDPNVVKVAPPSIIEVDGGVTIFVDYDGNVTIEGHKSMKLDRKSTRLNSSHT